MNAQQQHQAADGDGDQAAAGLHEQHGDTDPRESAYFIRQRDARGNFSLMQGCLHAMQNISTPMSTQMPPRASPDRIRGRPETAIQGEQSREAVPVISLNHTTLNHHTGHVVPFFVAVVVSDFYFSNKLSYTRPNTTTQSICLASCMTVYY